MCEIFIVMSKSSSPSFLWHSSRPRRWADPTLKEEKYFTNVSIVSDPKSLGIFRLSITFVISGGFVYG